MNIIESTSAYEKWLGSQMELVRPDIKYKHRQMANPMNPFPFFRGTFYHWLQLWTRTCAGLADAPRCQAIGDLHIENFGTWRDSEGRLNWGVNDFDEADEYPYTIDLVRLAASAAIARSIRMLKTSLSKACQSIEFGYRQQLENGGKPFILEEKNRHLRRLAYHQEREPRRFWKKLTRALGNKPFAPPKAVKDLLLATVPKESSALVYRPRPRVGMGSLGKPRIVLLARYSDAWLAREAKQLVPSAKRWLEGRATDDSPKLAQTILKASVRCPDPYLQYGEQWVIRRLGPHCGRIELSSLPDIAEEARMFVAMGREIGNIHLGTGKSMADIKKHLAKLPENWLSDTATQMAEVTVEDWRSYVDAARRRKRRRAAE